jgi:hypothetical protein
MRNVIALASRVQGRRLNAATIVVLVVAVAAGVLAAVALIDSIRGYHATHHQIVAQVTEEAAIVAQVTWQDDAGVQHEGRVRTPLDHVSDTQARIWLDREGRLAPRPFGPVEVVFCFLLAAASAGGAVWLMWWRASLLRRWWTDRRVAAPTDDLWHGRTVDHP